jgi:hypothetical protein
VSSTTRRRTRTTMMMKLMTPLMTPTPKMQRRLQSVKQRAVHEWAQLLVQQP